jgi:environmental stress-induced protein Ves
MSWQQIELLSVAPSPWRNGGGVTRELLAWPAAQDWHWRLSVAEVAHSGPFSRFEGVQRWFAVLHGAGVRLSVGGRSHVLTGASAPLCFDGALLADCELLDGATQDFNLMLRAGQGAAHMRRVAGETSFDVSAASTVAIYTTDSGATVNFEQDVLRMPPHSLAWRSLPAGARVGLSAVDALWMEITA